MGDHVGNFRALGVDSFSIDKINQNSLRLVSDQHFKLLLRHSSKWAVCPRRHQE
jgi:hypothetical protein